MLALERSPFHDKKTQQTRGVMITATDIAKILGLNRYCSRTQLLRLKLKLAQRQQGSEAMSHGVKFEPEALRVYELVSGNTLMEEEIGFVRGSGSALAPTYLGVTPDSAARTGGFLVEIKCPFYKELTACSGRVCPALYFPQMQAQMAVTGLRLCYLVQYVPPCMSERGSIHVAPVEFQESWWVNKALPAIASFYAELQRIQSGELPGPKRIPRRKKSQRKAKKRKLPCFVTSDRPTGSSSAPEIGTTTRAQTRPTSPSLWKTR
jgi:putative phage-type endonuclease